MSRLVEDPVVRSSERPERPAWHALLHLVESCKVPYGHERSFKMLSHRLLSDRVLVGMNTGDVDVHAFSSMVETLGIPAAGQRLLTGCFARANAVFLATEDEGPRRMFKAYLEFWDEVRARVRAGDASPQLLHLGVKWSSDRPGHHEEARYTCYPLLAVHDVLRRMRAVHAPGSPDQGLRIAQDLVREGARRRPGASFLYLEASEAANARRSYDVNFYKTGMQVADAAGHLQQAAVHFGVEDAALRGVLAPMLALPLGHVAGGTARDGGEFLSVYAEVAPLPEAG